MENTARTTTIHRILHNICYYGCLFFLIADFTPNILQATEICAPDQSGNVGRYPSLVLDRNNHPIVSFYDLTNRDLKLMICNDSPCKDKKSIKKLDTTGMIGTYNSMQLGKTDNPIVSYYDATNGVLKLLHCDNSDCETYSTSIPDSESITGKYTSLVLDNNGFPVISYYDVSNGDLKLLHCDDAKCTENEMENISTPDNAGDVGLYTSIALDNTGNPVISYYASNTGLKIIHCDDPKCTGDESPYITTPDRGELGWYTSLALDTKGYPVVAYFDFTNANLKILHCDDPNCAGDESKNISSPDTAGNVGAYLSMKLDFEGNPIISYFDSTNSNMKMLHCDDPNCAGDESGNIKVLDSVGEVGLYTSLDLDTAGNPVVSYYDFTNGDLKIVRCLNQDNRNK
jgi:hypothetical protein